MPPLHKPKHIYTTSTSIPLPGQAELCDLGSREVGLGAPSAIGTSFKSGMVAVTEIGYNSMVPRGGRAGAAGAPDEPERGRNPSEPQVSKSFPR
jgi:hypothetical protein